MKQADKHVFRSLSSKIFFRIFIVYFFIASVLTAFQMVDVYLRHKHSFMQKMDTYGQSIEESIGVAIWDYDQQKVNILSEGILKIPVVIGIKITSLKDGSVILKKGIVLDEAGNVDVSHSINVNSAIGDSIDRNVLSIFRENLLESPRTIQLEKHDKPVAVLVLYSNTATMFQGVKYSLLIILGSAILKTFTLWCLFTLILGRYLVRPLQELTHIVSAVQARSIKSSTSTSSSALLSDKKGHDELSVLQMAFHKMLTRLEEANNHIEATNQTLNQEVSAKQLAMEEVRVLNEKLENRILERTERLEESESFMRQLVEGIPNPVFFKGLNGRYDMVNEAFKEEFDLQGTMYGAEASLMDADFLQDASIADEEKRDKKIISSQGIMSYEVSLKDHRGNLHELLISKAPMLDTAADCLGVVGMMVNIQKRKALERELQTFATIDALTGCYNRRYFLEQSVKEISRGSRHVYMQTLLYLDIDHFKKVNDKYGHQVGDRVLVQFALECKSLFRDGDIIGRLGGEEFAVLLPHTTMESAIQVAERLRQRIESMEVRAREIVKVTTSIGISAVGDGIDLEESIRRADTALYVAKSKGRNQVRCFQESNEC